MSDTQVILSLIALFAGYFLPAIISAARSHPDNLAIFLTNLLLGWTGLGWIIALIWSATSKKTPQ